MNSRQFTHFFSVIKHKPNQTLSVEVEFKALKHFFSVIKKKNSNLVS